MEIKDIVQVGAIVVAAIAGYITLKVQFERHEKEDDKEFESMSEQLKAIYIRLGAVEVKQAGHDENSKHTTEALRQIADRLSSIETLLRSRRQTDE